jgi:hypothetical protein
VVAALLAATAFSPCPPTSAATHLPLVHAGRPLRGSLAGFGPARVSVRVAAGAPASCAFFLVARRKRARLVARLPGWDASRAARTLVPAEGPRLVGLWRLGERRGFEVVVQLRRGASDADLAVYGIRGRRFVRIDVPPTGTFDWGGFSAAATAQLDCTPPPLRIRYVRQGVVATNVIRVWSATLRLVHDRFRVVSSSSRVGSRGVPTGRLFAHCRGVVGIRDP